MTKYLCIILTSDFSRSRNFYFYFPALGYSVYLILFPLENEFMEYREIKIGFVQRWINMFEAISTKMLSFANCSQLPSAKRPLWGIKKLSHKIKLQISKNVQPFNLWLNWNLIICHILYNILLFYYFEGTSSLPVPSIHA